MRENKLIKYVIENDLDDVLKYILDVFDIDPYDEPIFVFAFKMKKLRCAKTIFEKGISSHVLYSCFDTLEEYTPEQLKFLIEDCNVNTSAFPENIYKRYAVFYDKPTQKRNKDCCIVS